MPERALFDNDDLSTMLKFFKTRWGQKRKMRKENPERALFDNDD